MNSFIGKTILSFLRDGNYAHAGEEEAINLVMQRFAKNSNRSILDIGCGIGGTAKFMQEHGWGKVLGVDIDEEAIKYAQKTYPDVEFQVCNALNVASIPRQFDLICLFNVLYAIADRKAVLEAFYKIAKENTNLIIFDYVDLGASKNNDNQYFINPTHTPHIRLEDFPVLAKQSGWEITEIKNLDLEYIRWYDELLAKIENNRHKIRELFGEEALATTEKTYNDIYNSLLNKTMGGTIIYAKPNVS